MRLTDFHCQFYAHELTRRCASDSDEKLTGALVDAQVDLNPHQVEAALFAFRSPLSRGSILADEVGLGKTIEAGLVLSQKWAERKRRLLVVTPANLRKQWHQELREKFFLPCRILEAKSYADAVKAGQTRPFEPGDAVVICSYQFARSRSADVAAVDWHAVVLDEAHRLRNVYKPGNVIANVLKVALARAPKLLLTATPLQNSLLELFGLVSFIDDHAFGDLKSFRERFANLDEGEAFDALKARLKPVCHRTLRKQVLEYVPFTRRHAMVQEFTPAHGEDRLYALVSEYLQRDNLKALPAGQRSLMTMVLRKLLASSTFAIAGALDTLIARLKGTLNAKTPRSRRNQDSDSSSDSADGSPGEPGDSAVEADFEAFDETSDEWGDDPDPPLAPADRDALRREVDDLTGFRDLAVSITHNSKGAALLAALTTAFARAEAFGAAHKAIVFTESRRTQDYLLRLLGDSPHRDGIVLFNGSNTDARSKEIYAEWARANAGTDRVTGSRTADMRSALVDYFRDRGKIMIATEAGAEGINLQFCALVVNYDLPWNPQRIEQRIGRCHRYGQKHDVVVVNFLNRSNAADQRVFQLLAEKFALFEGVFGASDEVLGAIESGVDFEKRIGDIYQRCRTPADIAASFDRLQAELTGQIAAAMTTTRRKLLENFDEEVHEKLRLRKGQSESSLGRYEKLLMRLTAHGLGDAAAFDADGAGFALAANPFAALDIPAGRYVLPRRAPGGGRGRRAPLPPRAPARAVAPQGGARRDAAAGRGRLRLRRHLAPRRRPLPVPRPVRAARRRAAERRVDGPGRGPPACRGRHRRGRLARPGSRRQVLRRRGGRRPRPPRGRARLATRGRHRPPASRRGPGHRGAQRPALRRGGGQARRLGRRPQARAGARDQGVRPPLEGGAPRRRGRADPRREARRAAPRQGDRGEAQRQAEVAVRGAGRDRGPAGRAHSRSGGQARPAGDAGDGVRAWLAAQLTQGRTADD